MQPDNQQPAPDQDDMHDSQDHVYTEPAMPQNPETELQQEETIQRGDQELVRWQSPEYINKPKGTAWYAWFGLVVLGFMALAIFVMKSYSFAVLIPIMAVSLVLYITRPAPIVSYVLSRKGLHMHDKLHPYENYREFGLIRDGGNNMIMLVPRKRFSLGLTFYFPEEAGEAVVDILAARLPMKEMKPDMLDRIIKKLGM